MTGQPTNSLLATLQKDSLLNEIASDQFTYQLNDFEILCFYETRMMEVRLKNHRFLPQMTSMVGQFK